VAKQHNVDIFENTGADVVGLGSQQLFGNPGPQLDRSRKVLPLHHLLNGQGCNDVERHSRVYDLRHAQEHILIEE
jgi:hypothetical protein